MTTVPRLGVCEREFAPSKRNQIPRVGRQRRIPCPGMQSVNLSVTSQAQSFENECFIVHETGRTEVRLQAGGNFPDHFRDIRVVPA